MFGTDVSAAFTGAFDRMGDNAKIEWKVNFTCVPEPSPYVLLVIGLLGLFAFCWRRQKQAAQRSRLP
jgi:hypothetical protein